MNKIVKNFVFVLFLTMGLNFNASAKEQIFVNKANVQALAALTSSSSFNQLTPKDNVSLDRTWTIKFNSDVTMDKIEGIVIQKDTQFIPVVINKISNDSITVKPVNSYEKGSKYSLKLFLSNGKKHNMDFTTEGSASENVGVNSIVDVNLNQFKVVFNNKVDVDSAENVANYKIDGSALISKEACAQLLDDGQTVLITLLNPKEQNKDYTISVTKSILTENKISTIDGFDKLVKFTDYMVPTLKSVTAQGNKQLAVEFSEAVDMQSISEIANKIKINGQDIKNFGLNLDSSKLKNGIAGTVNGTQRYWASKVEFNFDSALPFGSNTLKVIDGTLCDAAGFILKESSIDFAIDTQITKPAAKSVEATADGTILIRFDRAMDKDSTCNLNNYELNSTKLSMLTTTTPSTISLKENGTVAEIKGLSGKINAGDNVLYINSNVKDTFGNNIEEDTRLKFSLQKDEVKPVVTKASIIDSGTIRIQFSKNINHIYANNISNYKLQNTNYIDITKHIKEIKASNDITGDANSYDIKLFKTAGEAKAAGIATIDDDSTDWRLNGENYILTIKNLIDTSVNPNAMDDYTNILKDSDNVAPKAIGAVRKSPESNESVSHKVVVSFSEEMDQNSLKDANNYRYVNKSGDAKALPSNTKLTVNGDNKSVTIEFSSSLVITPDVSGDNDNIITYIVVTNVKDTSENMLDGIAAQLQITNSVSNVNRASLKDNSFKLCYDGDDIIAEFQYSKEIDTLEFKDFTVAGETPDSGSINGGVIRLRFKDGSKDTSGYNKTDVIKAKGVNAKLVGSSNMKTADIAGTTVNPANATVYDYQLSPKTSSDHWYATTDGRIVITFDSLLDVNSGIKVDDFVFTTSGGELKAGAVEVKNNTLVFSGFNNTSAFVSTNGTNLDNLIKVRVKDTISVRTRKDFDGNYANYKPSDDDLKNRDVKYVVTHDDTVYTGTFNTGLIDGSGNLGGSTK